MNYNIESVITHLSCLGFGGAIGLIVGLQWSKSLIGRNKPTAEKYLRENGPEAFIQKFLK